MISNPCIFKNITLLNNVNRKHRIVSFNKDVSKSYRKHKNCLLISIHKYVFPNYLCFSMRSTAGGPLHGVITMPTSRLGFPTSGPRHCPDRPHARPPASLATDPVWPPSVCLAMAGPDKKRNLSDLMYFCRSGWCWHWSFYDYSWGTQFISMLIP